MMSEANFVSGYVGLVGRPNCGKSTLLNQAVGQLIAVTHAKPQTTRHRIMGMLTTDEVQMIFLDTPGLHRPRHALGHFMVNEVDEVMADCDVLVWLIDVTRQPGPGDAMTLERMADLRQRRRLPPVVMGFNKIDALGGREERLAPRMDAYWEAARARLGEAIQNDWSVTALSARTGFGVPELLKLVQARLPAGPLYYDPDQVTDQPLREIVAELVRKQALQLLSDEIPHGIAVDVLEYEERSPTLTYISAVIYVERDSHKPMVLGHRGKLIRRLGSMARREIEELVEMQVYLELWVKVRRNWRKRSDMLRHLGFAR